MRLRSRFFKGINKTYMPKSLWLSAGLVGARSILCPWQSSPVSQTKMVQIMFFHFKGICRDHKLRLRKINNLNPVCFVVELCPRVHCVQRPRACWMQQQSGPLLVEFQRCHRNLQMQGVGWERSFLGWDSWNQWRAGRREVSSVRKWNIYGETKWSKDLYSYLASLLIWGGLSLQYRMTQNLAFVVTTEEGNC